MYIYIYIERERERERERMYVLFSSLWFVVNNILIEHKAA